MIIDSHAHLYSPGVDKEAVLASLENEGIYRLINIGTTAQNSELAVRATRENERVFAAVGIHPDYANEVTEVDLELIDKLAYDPKVVAIGEIGLDYHTNDTNKDKQKELFIRQLEIAIRHKLPVCIHSRQAREDTFEILSRYRELEPSVMHCFSENGEYAKKYLDLGFYISFSGNITYKKSDRSYLKDLPLDRILVETDSPYLAPQEVRGVKNEPRFVKLTAKFLAAELGLDYEEFVKKTVENTFRVFKRLK